MRTTEARFPSPVERRMAKRLSDLVVQVERATLDPRPVRAETLQAVESVYGAAWPWPNWFLVEIEGCSGPFVTEAGAHSRSRA
jgi:hypothetical protein